MMTHKSDEPSFVFVLDDDLAFAGLATRWLEDAGVTRVAAFSEPGACLDHLRLSPPDAICLDLHLGEIPGTAVLEQIRGIAPDVPVIMLTADGDTESVVAAMRLGAYDYLVKPVEPGKLRLTVAHAVERRRMAARLASLERTSREDAYAGVIGRSEPMSRLLRLVDKAGPSDVPVLICGEVGTGKSLIARAVHARSRRRMRPFVTLDCPGQSASWHEPSLFGYEHGASPRTKARARGAVDEAEGGTLLVHEVSALASFLQGPLCELIERGRFRRAGSATPLRSDVRVVATTHADLRREAETGGFREDLYFRLTGFELEVPPLRARCDDIPQLAEWFLQQHAGQEGRLVPSLTSEALDALMRWRWPGNVRELGNVLYQALLTAPGRTIGVADLPSRLVESDAPDRRAPDAAPARPRAHQPAPTTLALSERAAIREALAASQWNLAAASRMLAIGRSTLYRKMRAHGLGRAPASPDS